MKRFIFFASFLLFFGLTGCDRGPAQPTGELFLRTEPSGALVEINGEVLGQTPFNQRVPVGRHLVTLRRSGFETERLSIDLGTRESREITLRPVTGLMVIDSNPPGAAVSINDIFQGNTPLAMHNIRMGTHRARLVMQGYEDRDIEFTVENRIPFRVNADLVSNSGTLVVESDPPGATVLVDGRNEGLTPLSLPRVERGERAVTVQLGGYETYRTNLVVNPSDTARVNARLNPIPGSLRVVSIPTGARIYLNDSYRGDAPLHIESLPPGNYLVRAELRGHADESRTLRVNRGDEMREEFRMTRNSGTLEIITRPANVRVNVNGEYMGTTRPRDGGTDEVSEPLQIDLLSQGTHRLQLVREGFQFESKNFRINMDEVTTLEETLRRIFIPNTILRLGSRPDEAIIGRLVRRHPDGSVEMEIREGIFRTYPPDDIISIEPLREDRLDNE